METLSSVVVFDFRIETFLNRDCISMSVFDLRINIFSIKFLFRSKAVTFDLCSMTFDLRF